MSGIEKSAVIILSIDRELIEIPSMTALAIGIINISFSLDSVIFKNVFLIGDSRTTIYHITSNGNTDKQVIKTCHRPIQF